jgi:CRP-like cAMP-binding protein
MSTAQAGTIRKFEAPVADHARNGITSPLAPLAGLGTQVTVKRGQEIIAEGMTSESCYRIVSGSVRLVKLMADGRRQVCEFLVPGDFIGLENQQQNYFSAEAVAETVLVRYPLRQVEALIASTPALARHMRAVTSGILHRAYERMVLICHRTAHERIAWFLLEMMKRSASGDSVVLPMTRADIADYLGLVIETVSRVLTQFKHSGTIAIRNVNRIVLLDRDALEAVRGEA